MTKVAVAALLLVCASTSALAQTDIANEIRSISTPSQLKTRIGQMQTAQQKLDMQCTYEEGASADLVTFTRPGLQGELTVTGNRFEIDHRPPL